MTLLAEANAGPRLREGDVAPESLAEEALPLMGRLLAVKDNIASPDFPTTCASRILEGFRSPIKATAVELLEKAGMMVVGKTNMDEFGMGSYSIHSCKGPVKNLRHRQKTLSVGGSSGGSALAVHDRMANLALGTDTGGSIRIPAAYTNTIGFKPSYGRISRYGVVPYANSLDTVGIIGQRTAYVRKAMGECSHACIVQ